MRNWLLFFFLISCLRLAAQTDSAAKRTPVKKKPAAAAQSDSAAKKAPVKKKATVTAQKTAAAKTAADAALLAKADTLAAAADTLQAATPVKRPSAYDIYLKQLSATHPFLKTGNTRFDINPLRPYRDLDWLVYLMAGVVLLLGIIRLSYLKYFSDLFRAFLNPTLSQRQLKDQLSQSPFPNFLLNAFFVISLGIYLYLLMFRQQYISTANAWMVIPGVIVLVALIYTVKYLMLRFCGWLFGSAELADAYIFILYLINKVLGILLVPFLVILAFCKPEIARAFLYISIFFIVLLVIYRYVRSYSVVKQYLSFSRLHFFLYLCAFEVAPVLILAKVLLIWLTGNP